MSSKSLSVFLSLMCLSLCQGITVNYAIEEEKGTDYYLGRVSSGAKLKDHPKITSNAEFESLQYSLLTSGNSHADFFTVNERTSDLYTKKTIDRDELCRYTDNCVLKFEVAADTSVSDFFVTISINVNIIDINDNVPSFPSDVVNLELSEATVSGTSVWKGVAEDKDHGIFSVQNYTLSRSDTPFAIDTEFFADGRTQVTLKVNQNLDRETNSSFELMIFAIDGGTPPQSGTVTINIIITDINDNPPTFSKPVYNVTIKDDLPEGTVIVRVHADDPDEGSSGTVRYRLSSLQSGDISRLFSINNQTGDLRVVHPLTKEARKKFTIIVEASDLAVSPQISKTSQSKVIVQLLDTHNTSPEVTLTTIQSNINVEYVEYAENSPIGITLAIVIVEDYDTGSNGAVTCSVNDDHFHLTSDSNNEYNVVLGKTLDREVSEWHEVIVTCTDTGSPPLSSSDNFRLRVLDVNDIRPKFTQAVYYITIEENGVKGTSIVQVHANDNDATGTGNVLYSLTLADEYKDMFSIDSTKGLIYVEESLDREINPVIMFEVQATDDGNPSLTGTANVQITVLDINDNDPVFTPQEFQFMIPENRPPDSSVGRISALDNDSGVNAAVTYGIVTAGGENIPFLVMPNGTILTKIYLDRETTATYTFSVMASDKGTPSRSSTAIVVVNILDENDNPPIFIYPDKNTDVITVSYQSLPNTVVATIQAHDPDIGFNSKLSYYMNGSDILQKFSLNRYTGQFSMTTQLDQSDIGSYDLILIAEDEGNQQNERSLKLSIIDKATVASSHSENQIKYFSIAVAISCVTVVLSILIVLAICLIKRKERQRHDKIAESVTTCSSLETDSEGSDIRFNDIYTRSILYKTNTNSLKKSDKSSATNPIKKPFTSVACIDDVRPEVISESVAIWDWSDEYGTSLEKKQGHSLPYNPEPFSTFSRTKQKNKVHWQASQC